MNHAKFSDELVRRIAKKLEVPTDSHSTIEKMRARITELFSSTDVFGEIARIEPSQRPDSTVIFCHGLGGAGSRWKSLFADKLASQLPTTRFILPTAPNRRLIRDPSTEIRAWYDFTIDGDKRTPNLDDLLVSAAYIRFLAQQEVVNIEPQTGRAKVFVGGFSQGATLSLYMLLTDTCFFDGILALSGYSPRFEDFDGKESHTQIQRTPLFIAHGEEDEVLPVSLHEETLRFLKENGTASQRTTAKVYKGLRHSTSLEEMNDIARFLKNILNM